MNDIVKEINYRLVFECNELDLDDFNDMMESDDSDAVYLYDNFNVTNKANVFINDFNAVKEFDKDEKYVYDIELRLYKEKLDEIIAYDPDTMDDWLDK